jgi:glutathione synthase/RimK-type ligase-like ATP-grasp enzyme
MSNGCCPRPRSILPRTPPAGLFWSRLSASAHTRTDPHVKEYGRAVLDWLAAAGRRVINGRGVYELEVSKIRQHRELAGRSFDVPRTAAAFGPQALVEAAGGFTPPFITKHNQGGKGLGVRRFDSHAELEAAADEFAPGGANAPIDGITLIQEYVQPAQPFITRAEFIGGRFHYAVRVDVSGGSFELCPADACAVPGTGARSRRRGGPPVRPP